MDDLRNGLYEYWLPQILHQDSENYVTLECNCCWRWGISNGKCSQGRCNEQTCAKLEFHLYETPTATSQNS